MRESVVSMTSQSTMQLRSQSGLRTSDLQNASHHIDVANPNRRPPKKELVFAFVDDFEEKTVDLNGDGEGDIAHGKMSATYAIAAARKEGLRARYVPFDIDRGGVVKQFQALAHQLRSGAPFDGVNVSLTLKVPWVTGEGKSVTDEKGEPVLVTALVPNIARAVYPGDPRRQQALIDAGELNGAFSPRQLQDMRQFFSSDPSTKPWFDAFGELSEAAKQRGIPLSLSAGNSQQHFNGYSLHTYATPVGATTTNGKTSAFSSEVTRVRATAPGIFNVRLSQGGVDVTGDRKPDLSRSELTKKPTEAGLKQLARVDGKQLSDVAATDRDYATVAAYYTQQANFFDASGRFRRQPVHQPAVIGKVFDAERLAKAIRDAAQETGFTLVAGETSADQRILELTADGGGFVTFTTNSDRSGVTFSAVRVKEGVVSFDPAGDKNPGEARILNVASGTSYAAPTWLGHEAARRAKARQLVRP
jgi:hypothetical protein